jgi:multidrug resistance efflux pump
MTENLDPGSRGNSRAAPPSKPRGHAAILRASSLVVASILALLLITAVVPPIVADQSDRAVVDAPVALLTAPIDGEIASLSALPGNPVDAGMRVARISNVRLDRGILISLEEKVVDGRERLQAAQEKRNSDQAYLGSLDHEIVGQTDQIKAQFQSQIIELQARVAESESLGGEKKALVERQTNMVARDAASMDMLKPTTQQYSAALHKADADRARLNQKAAQLNALENGVYVGDDLIALGALAQKRRDIALDARRMQIEEKQFSAVLNEQEQLLDAERKRLESLTEADVRASSRGQILNVGALPGRHVNAGDSVASLVDCDKRFVVAIFSYRQGQTMKVGTTVSVEGGSFGPGVITAILPRTSDKIDERFAVPFPQTERRELYAIIAPESPTAAGQENVAAEQQTAAGDGLVPCGTVGQWVTVTKDNGIVPSMSVAWRRLETLLTSGSHDKDPVPQDKDDSKRREAGTAILAEKLRAGWRSGLEDWMPRTDATVSR